MDERICPVCLKGFVPTNHNQVYCPGKPGKRSRCARRVSNAKRGGWDPSSLPFPEPFDCTQCGEHCIPGENVAHHATKFCGYDCKMAWHKARLWLESVTDEAGAYQCVAYRKAMRRDPCAYCGADSQELDHIVARSRGGSDDWHNRAGTCSRCNGRKQDVPLLIWMGWKLQWDQWAPWNEARRQLLTRSRVAGDSEKS